VSELDGEEIAFGRGGGVVFVAEEMVAGRVYFGRFCRNGDGFDELWFAQVTVKLDEIVVLATDEFIEEIGVFALNFARIFEEVLLSHK
jgi:hypothetical protein